MYVGTAEVWRFKKTVAHCYKGVAVVERWPKQWLSSGHQVPASVGRS